MDDLALDSWLRERDRERGSGVVESVEERNLASYLGHACSAMSLRSVIKLLIEWKVALASPLCWCKSSQVRNESKFDAVRLPADKSLRFEKWYGIGRVRSKQREQVLSNNWNVLRTGQARRRSNKARDTSHVK